MNNNKRWTEQEVEFLKSNFTTLSYYELSLKLNRPIKTIKSKKGELKLKRNKLLPLQIGEKVGKLTIIKMTNRRGTNGQAYFECECVCGKVKEIMGTAVRSGTTISCGCYSKTQTKERCQLDIGEASLNNLEYRCRGGAKKRRGGAGIPYNLTKEQLRRLIKQDCYWCGDSPKPYNVYYKADGSRAKSGIDTPEKWAEKQWILANGVDRLDSNLGYTLDNCVSSCWPCNEMKMDKSEKEFLEHMDKILNFQKIKNRI